MAPTLRSALEMLKELELKPLMAQALHMGDEVHNRNVAASSLLIRRLVPALLKSAASPADAASVIEFIAGNDHFFLNISMAACKAMLDAAHGVPGSSMVTAMARNGVEFGVRVSGLGERWFTAPAPVVNGLYFPAYTIKDAAPDLGDSAITETAGLGGFAMAAAPAIVKFVGGSPQDALANTLSMTHITLRPQRRLHPARARFHRHPGVHRRAPGGRHRNPPGHQHRHRASRAGRGPDRRRRYARPACVLHGCDCRARCRGASREGKRPGSPWSRSAATR